MTTKTSIHFLSAALAGLILVSGASRAAAQDAGSDSVEAVIPGNEGVLRIGIVGPGEARVADSFDYQIRVSNIAENLVLYDVKVEQKAGQQFQIESSEVQRAQNQQQGQQQGQQQNQQQNQQQGQNQQNNQQAQQGAQQGQWVIDRIMPGESRMINVTAASDQIGETPLCVAVTSYTPAVCTTMEFVKPELELVKRAPESAALCEVIEYEYFVKNTGSTDLDQFQIQDKLDDGIITVTGEQNLQFSVDGLEAGETRKFVASVQALRSGEFASRAVAIQQNGEKTRSQRHQTRIQAADLAVEINGPSVEYLGDPVSYTVRVANVGDVAAPETRLTLYYPETANMVRMGDWETSNQTIATGDGATEQQKGQPTIAADGGQADGQRQGQGGQNQAAAADDQNMNSETWEIGRLDPGQTLELSYTLRPSEPGMLHNRAAAAFVCDVDQEAEEARIDTTAVALTQTEIISLPALHITVTDNQDPVAVDGELAYTVVVVNEGTAQADNVSITAKLPEQLQFVEASGETEATSEGNNVRFGSVETMASGDKAQWQIKARVTQTGDVRMNVELTSDSFEKAITSEEPTQLFQGN